MAERLNLIDKKFGKLTVLEKLGSNKHNKRIWKCICDCPKHSFVIASTGDLKSGNTLSCGCLKSESIRKITIQNNQKDIGKKFNRLTTISFLYINSYKSFFLFKCDCGKDVINAMVDVKRGNTKSCGCLFLEHLESLRLRVKELHPNWKSNLTDEDRDKNRKRSYNIEYINWSKNVKIKDNYTCQISGQLKGHLEAHHIYNWGSYPELRFDINNGVTLSVKLHKLYHKLYGKENNTLDQFLKFKERYNNGEFNE